MKLILMIAALLVVGIAPVAGHHPGAQLDEVTAEREPAFEVTDKRSAPQLELITTDEDNLDLSQFSDQIIVLSFMLDDCSAECAALQTLLQEVQVAVNATPMRDMVQFVTVLDTAAPELGWESENWIPALLAEGDAAEAAEAFASLSDRETEKPLVHVLDRGGRHAGIFHGADFAYINMVLYINGLTNAPAPEPGLRERLLGVFR